MTKGSGGAGDPQSTARAHLGPDEQLYWAGTSDPAKRFSGRDGFLVPFSLLWLGFVVFWMVSAITGGAPPFFLLFGTVFVLIGLHITAGRFIVKQHRKRTTVYAVTDRRALVITPGGTRDVPIGRTDRTVSWTRDRSHCTVEWGSDGGGSIFAANGMNARVYGNTGLDGLFGPQPMAFWDVSDGEGLVRALDRTSR
ncbi:MULTISPECIES: hypothetical protein [unclassified Curtobacterium]|uniref:hypothetical protein n=1 Tax=unclassified Curtobacterium TaxID=257496 RepID=UPI0008DCC428|nr:MULTISPECIES: hypothetical protein [unclassified Curtobacterium]OIH94163.1 hypothetical protein BIU92_06945 [Curtobacterium sp. MCBA15_003]OII29341.1 hypothetical protein BIU94_13055 [Curtobacterium sp. MMLR14_006]